jgi:hypothetical protein
MKQERTNHTTQTTELLSRGEAIKKLGGYAALTALGTFMILNPQKAQASSPIDPGGGGGTFNNPCTDGDPATCCPLCYDDLARTECPTGECAGSIESNGDCDTGTPCTPPEPFQGNDNTTTKFNFESKYKSKYKSKYTKK